MPTPLYRFVQISDLHMGPLDRKSLDARIPFWNHWRWFTGVLGHSADALEDLIKFWGERRESAPQPQLILTGDLTAVGKREEFDIADQYLAGILRDQAEQQKGLEVVDWGKLAIPGNHDHWLGLPVPIGRKNQLAAVRRP